MSFSRREALWLFAAGASAAGGARCLAWAKGGQPVFREPPAAPADRSEPGVVAFNLEAKHARIVLGGRPVTMWTYGGSFPGVTLNVREGDTVRLRFLNGLPEQTNLHFHGLHIPPTGRADNIWISIPPGERFDYEFTIPAGEAGTYWYHPHYHGTIARQLWAGLGGAIVVRGPLDAMPELAAADERVVVLRDIAIDGDRPTAHRPHDWLDGKEGGLVLVNGLIQPRLQVRSGILRLRLINTSNARYFRLGLTDRRPFHLIATDGHFLERPVAVEQLLLSPANRADILISFGDDRPIDLLHLPYDRRSSRLPRRSTVLMTLVPPRRPRPLPLPGRLIDIPVLSMVDATKRREVVMAMLRLNGRPFKPYRVDASGRVGDLELWRVVNFGVMDHNFHIHTWYFQVVARNGRSEPFRAWRDTVNLRPGDRLDLLIPLRNYTGKSVYHCHIAEHGDMGMMGVIEVGNG